MRRLAALLGAAFTAQGLLAGAQQPTFRSATDAVLVDVAVRLNRRTVANLTKADFALTDNGVPQEIDDAGVSADPVDLSLIVDTSYQMRSLGIGPAVLRDADAVQSMLKPGDRGSLITFDSQVRWGRPSVEAEQKGERGAVLFDAIFAALMTRVEPGRRHAVVGITSGLDTHSLLAAGTRKQILERSEPPVYLIALGQRVLANGFSVSMNPNGQVESNAFAIMGDFTAPLRDLAEATGGRLFDLRGGDTVLPALKDALDEFRTRYVLRFRPKGVAASGWHALSVKVTRDGRYEIQARRGYWRD